MSEIFFYFVPEKKLKLKRPTISTSIITEHDGRILTLQTDVMAKNIYLNYPGVEGSYSDNYFDLLPGELKKVYFRPINNKFVLKNPFSVKTILDYYQ